MNTSSHMRALAIAAALGFIGSVAHAASFYEGKQIRVVISTGVAGGYAAYARLLTQFLGDHLAGHPDFFVQSMPGGGGIRATNYLYVNAPKDGTTLGMIHSTAPLAPLYGAKGAKFDARNFAWLGSMNSARGICIAWHTSPIKTWHDMLTKPFIVGSSGAGSQMEVLPAMMNRFLGTKMKIVSGYKNGTDIFLAMERGELQGRCGGLLGVLRLTHPDWLPEHKVTVPIQYAAERNPEFPDSPAVTEFIKDDLTRQVFTLSFATQDMDRPVLAPPGLPAGRVEGLRAGFVATMNDPAFTAEAKKENLDIDWVSGEKVAEIVKGAYAMPADVIAAARAVVGGSGE